MADARANRARKRRARRKMEAGLWRAKAERRAERRHIRAGVEAFKELMRAIRRERYRLEVEPYQHKIRAPLRPIERLYPLNRLYTDGI